MLDGFGDVAELLEGGEDDWTMLGDSSGVAVKCGCGDESVIVTGGPLYG